MKEIVITSGKGGTGKTTIAINLALALTKYGRQTLVADADFYQPHVGLMLGNSNFEYTILSALEDKKKIKEIIYRHQSGLKIIPGNISLEQMHKKDIKKFNEITKELDKIVELSLYDCPLVLNKDTLEIIGENKQIILITTPDILSVTETLKAIKLLKQRKQNKILGIIVNKYSEKEHNMKIENIRAILGEKIIGSIPDNLNVSRALKLKQPVVYAYPDSKVATAFEKMACNIIEKPYEPMKNIKKGKLDLVLNTLGLKKWYESLIEEEENE